MADLFHLLDELNAPQDEAVEPEIAIRPDDDDEQPPVDQEEEDVDRQILSLPPVLIQAARAAHQEADEERLDLQDFVHHTSRDERQEYALLQHWWVQELQAPEILPWRADVMRPMMEAAFSDADESAVQERSTLQAILADVRQVDRERVQFVAAHLLQTRLQKIQEKPWFYSKEENNERMSLQEKLFLADYHSLLEEHLQTTVTNRFPQDVWRSLDEPDMIDEPDLDQYVMIKVVQDSTLYKGTEEPRSLDAGSSLIVNYRQIAGFMEAGAVQLIL